MGDSDNKFATAAQSALNGLPVIMTFTLVTLLYLADSLSFIEYKFQDERFKVVQRDASGDTIIIAIDSFSLKELGSWPWPRRHHAKLLDNLAAAGAKRIVFDLDFSSKSNNRDDREFESALKRAAGKVIMIAFQQYQHVGGIRIFSTSSPIEEFQKYAVTAAANIRSDQDGIIRRHSIFQEINHKKVLTIPAVLAPSIEITSPVFSLDFGIRAPSIPVLSYADVLLNRIDLNDIRGKNIIIGSTAIELGDQLAVPVYQSLPSVFVLVQAIESLAQNRAIMHVNPAVVVILMALLCIVFGSKFRNWSWRRGLALLLALFIAIIAITVSLYAAYPVSIDVVPLVTLLFLLALVGWTQQIDIQALAAFRSSMELENKDKLTHSIVDNAFDGILVFTANGKIEFLNKAAEKLFGHLAGEVIGKNISFIMGENRGENTNNLEPIDPTKFNPGESETVGIRKDGVSFPIDISISRIETPISRHGMERRRVPRISYVCSVRDISERKIKEAEFSDRHTVMTDTNRLISMSEMAAGLAHEINQPLTAIYGYLEGARRRLADISIVPATIIESIDKALNQADRTREIIHRTRDITRKSQSELIFADLNIIVEEVVELLKFDISRCEASIQLNLAPHLPKVIADATQIQQVLINLCRNGMEAMSELPPKSRLLTLETNADTDGFVIILVKDNGPGFNDEIKDRLFFPFTSSKKDGMGIGLSICDSIIDDHGGKITADKEPNGPTTFTVKLPVQESVEAKSGIIQKEALNNVIELTTRKSGSN